MNNGMNWRRQILRNKQKRDSARTDLKFNWISAATFREDPLPERPMKKRPGISLPKFKCLEKQD